MPATQRRDTQPLGDLEETLGRLLRNTVFRLSIVGSLLFGVSLLVAQLIVYDTIVSSEERRVEQGLTEELTELELLFAQGGEAALRAAQQNGLLTEATPQSVAQAIFDQGAQQTLQRVITLRDLSPDVYSMFVFKDESATGKMVTDEIEALKINAPTLEQYDTTDLLREEVIATVEATDVAEGDPAFEERRVLAIGHAVFQNDQKVGVIFVGRDVENIRRTGERMRRAMTTSSLIAVFLGILSSIFVARRFARRVDSLNKLATDVQAGHLDRRAPRNYSEDEMDRLAEHLIGMLAHIDRLMAGNRRC